MPCTANLFTMGRKCGSAMGGVKAVYLRGYGPDYRLGTHGHGGQEEDVVFDSRHFDYHNNGFFGILVGYLGANTYAGLRAWLGDLESTVGFYKIDTSRTGAQIVTTSQVNRDNGTRYYEHVLTLPVDRLSSQAVDLLHRLAGADVQAVAELYTGELLLLGHREAAHVSADSATTGASWGERQGYTIEITEISDAHVPVDPYFTNDDTDFDDAVQNRAVFKQFFVVSPNS